MNYVGISELEAQRGIIDFGYNELPVDKTSFILKSSIKTLKEPMILILIFACVFYFFIGEFRDFAILSFSAFVIFSINIYQNFKSEQAIKKLSSLNKKYCDVIREGIKKSIEVKYLVPGDYVVINEGDRVPADIIIIDNSNLLMDESILTGESIPIKKSNFNQIKEKIFNDNHMAFSGTLIKSGWLIGIVHQTGINTKIGQIGVKLKKIREEEPQVKKEIDKIVKNLAILCIVTCLVVFLFNFYKTSNFESSVLSSITLAIALVPEELPIVLTIFLAMSSLRLSKAGLIVKNKSIIETLGACNIICVDKTGTITKNELKLKKIILKDTEYDISNLEINDDLIELIKSSYLATYYNSKDSSDSEIINLCRKLDLEIPKMESITENVVNKKFIYSRQYLYRKKFLTFAKGAYEEISKVSRVNQTYEDFYLSKIEELSNIGYRIIAVAIKKETKISKSKKFEILGLLAFQDEIREESKEYVRICQENNIRVCLITGDYKNTASYFAKEAGISNFQNVITGDQIDKLDSEKLKEKISKTNVFARVTPEHKYKIVSLLKSSKNIIAMTGDGVNDVLALKHANVGISIGEGGSDIAKEASDIILTKNNLKNIVRGIIEGRRVYSNLGITGRYIYSFHLPIILIAIFNSFLQLPTLLTPVYIAILEFIIDPFSTLVFEAIPAKKDILLKMPRKGRFKLIENLNLKLGTFYGVLMFLLIFIPFYLLSINNYENIISLSLLNILGLNIILIFLNFGNENYKFKEIMKLKRFVVPVALLVTIFITGVYIQKVDLIGQFILVLSLGLFSIMGFLSKNSARI